MTNPIGTGTRNMALNVSADERDFWGRLAVDRGARSIGELQRTAMLLGLRLMSPAKAAELIEIRRRYYGAVLLVLFLGIMAASWMEHDDQSLVRRSARVRVVRTGIRRGLEESEECS